MKNQTILGICLFTSLFIGFLPMKADAEGISLKIKPSVLQIRATSPADIHAPFSLENLGDDSLSLKVILKRFRDSGDESGKIVYTNAQSLNQSDKDSFLEQAHVLDDGSETETITLGPKQEKKLTLVMDTQDAASEQDNYFSVIFLTLPTSKPDSDQADASDTSFSTVQAGIALPVLVSIAAQTGSTGFLDTFSAPLALQSGPVPFTVGIKNTGDHFIEARGTILIKNMFGQIVGQVDLPPANVLAGSTRLLSSATPGADQKAVWSEKFLLGFYTATLTIGLSPEQSLYTRSIHFVAFPFTFLIALVIISFVSFLLIRRIKKKVSEQ